MSKEKYIFDRLEQVEELAQELLDIPVLEADMQAIGRDITLLVNDVMLEMRG